ncbi:MAG: exodeoxyribonuclease V subunit gamma [Gracilimonas sp.]|nr:exodeoxyribonuclease V subunit gamma [Gracilimonas sp.]
MLYEYQSPSLTDLATKLSEVNLSDSMNPMHPVWIIVQNNEIKEWLSLQLAREQGISGNFNFIFPSEFIWTLYRLKNDSIPKTLPSDLNAMQWSLFELFGNEPNLISNIPSVNIAEISISKRFQLAGQIADVFDQYQVYRPDMLESWIQGKPLTNHADEIWQLKLWRRLNLYWNENEVSKLIPSRADAYTELLIWIKDTNEQLIRSLPDQIFVFGLSHLSRPFLDITSGLSRHRDVHFFSREILLDEPGTEGAELFKNWSIPYRLQLDYLHQILIDQKIPLRSLNADEKTKLPSIDLHSCHNPRREVEVLKDQILGYLNKNPKAQPNDILIMVPDPDQYASMIETVFNNSENDNGTSLPVTKLSRKQTQVYEHALVKILDVLNSSFKPSSIVDILVLTPVKERFGFNDDDISLLEEWINANRIYRGVGESFNTPFTWKKGLNQLFVGFTMAPDFLEVYRGLVPTVDSTSGEELKLAASFSKFIHALLDCLSEVKTNKTPKEWLGFTKRLVETLLVTPDTNDNGSSGLLRTLTKLIDQLEYTTSKEIVPYNVIKNWLKKQINTNRSASGRFGQGITVSTYVPYRSVPFNFIAVLGMNEGVFPRRTVRPEFDLIYKEPQTGDRIQSDDDTYLFLETLTAAEQHLHISYMGQDQRTEADRLPSMLVQQLKEVLPESGLNSTMHKLQAFSSKYFEDHKGGNPNAMPQSYSKKDRQLVENLNSAKNLNPDFIDNLVLQDFSKRSSLVSVNDIISYFTDPGKQLLTNEIGLSERLFNNEIEDRELFDLKSLDRYKVDSLLFDSLQLHANIESTTVFNYLLTSGMIPDKLQGEKVFKQELNNTKELFNEIREITSGDEVKEEVSVNYRDIEVYGSINGIYGNSLVLHRIGKRRASHEIRLWILHNILLASKYPLVNSYYISVDNKENRVETLKLDSNTIDRSVFEDLMEWYLSDKQTLDKLNFFPETSKEFVLQL